MITALSILPPNTLRVFDYPARVEPLTPAYRCTAHHLVDGTVTVPAGDTAYLFCCEGALNTDQLMAHHVGPLHWACLKGPVTIRGTGLVIVSHGWVGLDIHGGPIEAKGRLRYIDGCSDTILVGPPVKGNPCLNHLHFPRHISQTMHTHPSVRIGMVVRGRGRCVTPSGEHPLLPGMVWCLPVDDAHCFFTDDETMDIIAWHPDTDTGPCDIDHPMVNRTLVDGHTVAGDQSIATQGEIIE